MTNPTNPSRENTNPPPPPLVLRPGQTRAQAVTEQVRARFARDRAAALAAARLAHEEALARFTGRCRACLDTGRDAISQAYCACAEGEALAAADVAREARAEAARVTLAYEHALTRAGLPSEYDGLTLDTYPRQRAPGLLDVRRYLARFAAEGGRTGAVLHGPYGVGKTGLACAVARALTLELCQHDPAARFRIRFVVVARLLAQLRAAMGDKTGAYARLLSEAASARLLILDDLGRSNPGEWASETLFDVINARYNSGLPLLITTNYSEAALAERLGEHGPAMLDRIAARCVWLELRGASLRQRATL